MTYIRRKDDVIFSTNAEIEDIDIKEYKQIADTIEELCDEVVVVDKDFKKPVHNFIFEFHKEDYKNLADNFEIYGAIWTDKGLQYIAKMNSKGEIELLW